MTKLPRIPVSMKVDVKRRKAGEPAGDERSHQRLAAILFADIAGYTELMDADEAGTYETWRKARGEVVEPTVAAHRGRIVKFTGDGFLAEFPAAESAVTCAVKLQEAMTGRAPLRLRMGIHLGDIYLEGGDVYGDGVNVASRLEGLAQPGGVCISGTVHDLVRKKLQVEFVDGGRQALKHIAEPIQVWHIRAQGAPPLPPPKAAGNVEAATAALLQNLDRALKRPGIAVLPFDNISGDPEQEYFADGLAEDLITDLSRTGALFVIARNTTFLYKKQAVDVPKVARDLGVRFVLEGSVRRAGQRIRVTAQLIDGQTGGHIWADRYDRDLTDIFAVQDEITRTIVAALSLSLEPGRANLIVRKSTKSVEAYDLFLKAREANFQTSRSSNTEAEALARKAIAIDPSFASPYAVLANVHMLNWLNRWTDDPEGERRRSEENAQTAIRLNPEDPYGHWMMSAMAVWTHDYERAFAIAQKTLELDPTFVVAYTTIGAALLGLGRAADALRVFEATIATSPNIPPIMLHFRARALFRLKRYADAGAVLRERIARSPETDISRALLAAAYGHLGRIDEAKTVWSELATVAPTYSLEGRRAILPPAEFDLMVEGLAKAGLDPKT